MSAALASALKTGTLDLSRLHLNSLPSAVQTHLVNLREAEKNPKAKKAASVPLSKLLLSFNNLQALPLTIVFLAPSLRNITLDHNDFQFFPQQLLSLVLLEVLDLSHNQISELPPQIASLSTLRMLLLNNNCLTHLPAQLYSISTLVVVNVCNNYLDVVSVPSLHFDVIQGLNRQRVPSEILPNLYLGAYESAVCQNTLLSLNISHILTVGGGMPSLFATSSSPSSSSFKLKYKVFAAVQDVPSQDLLSVLPIAFEFLDAARKKEKKVLVHCREGISRSGSVVVAYVMRERDVSLQDALLWVWKKRPMVKPNQGFMKQLQEVERNPFWKESSSSSSSAVPLDVQRVLVNQDPSSGKVFCDGLTWEINGVRNREGIQVPDLYGIRRAIIENCEDCSFLFSNAIADTIFITNSSRIQVFFPQTAGIGKSLEIVRGTDIYVDLGDCVTMSFDICSNITLSKLNNLGRLNIRSNASTIIKLSNQAISRPQAMLSIPVTSLAEVFRISFTRSSKNMFALHSLPIVFLPLADTTQQSVMHELFHSRAVPFPYELCLCIVDYAILPDGFYQELVGEGLRACLADLFR